MGALILAPQVRRPRCLFAAVDLCYWYERGLDDPCLLVLRSGGGYEVLRPDLLRRELLQYDELTCMTVKQFWGELIRQVTLQIEGMIFRTCM